jgi:Flp pilus assembly protein TadG
MDASARTSKTKPLLILVSLLLAIFGAVSFSNWMSAQQQLEQVSMRLDQLTAGDTQQGREAAQLVVSQLRKIYDIPGDIEPTVATIVDVNTLRQRNAFYNKAKNGDYLVVTTDRAILFDAKQNVIIDVVPVQINPAAETNSSRAGQASSVRR